MEIGILWLQKRTQVLCTVLCMILRFFFFYGINEISMYADV